MTRPPVRTTDTRLRNLLWHRATTSGLADPLTGRVRVYSAAELARLWGVTRSAVCKGVRAAEVTLRGLRDVLEPP